MRNINYKYLSITLNVGVLLVYANDCMVSNASIENVIISNEDFPNIQWFNEVKFSNKYINHNWDITTDPMRTLTLDDNRMCTSTTHFTKCFDPKQLLYKYWISLSRNCLQNSTMYEQRVSFYFRQIIGDKNGFHIHFISGEPFVSYNTDIKSLFLYNDNQFVIYECLINTELAINSIQWVFTFEKRSYKLYWIVLLTIIFIIGLVLILSRDYITSPSIICKSIIPV